jgi:hypothetical protein
MRSAAASSVMLEASQMYASECRFSYAPQGAGWGQGRRAIASVHVSWACAIVLHQVCRAEASFAWLPLASVRRIVVYLLRCSVASANVRRQKPALVGWHLPESPMVFLSGSNSSPDACSGVFDRPQARCTFWMHGDYGRKHAMATMSCGGWRVHQAGGFPRSLIARSCVRVCVCVSCERACHKCVTNI